MRFTTGIRGGIHISILCVCIAVIWNPVYGDETSELEQQLLNAKTTLKNTQQKIVEFNQRLQEKRRTAQTISGQIEVLDDTIDSMTLSIQNTVAEVAERDAEITTLQHVIDQKEVEIENSKELLAQYIRQLQELDSQTNLSILLKYSTLADAITESATVETLQTRAHQTIVTITQLRDNLTKKQEEIMQFKEALLQLKKRQELQQKALEGQQQTKQRILNLTKAEAASYQGQLAQAQRDARQAESAISNLDSKIREQLRLKGEGNFGSVGVLDWPIEPIFGISCGFHCGGYPYAYLIGPHTGADMPTPVGTPIHAPADGYVGRTHDSGGPGYSYILLIHGENISTVYGHVSGFAVQEGKYVKRGDVIGYTGGAYRMRGAGLSTGAHLHFEVRKNNIPVNALGFLKPRAL